MKKIGMIGGLSWVSTAEYYKRINEITQERIGGVASARIVLESVNRQAYVEAVIDRQDEAAAEDMIAASAKALETAGADFTVISCNDVHRFVPAIQPTVSIPFLHIAQVTADAVKARGLKKIAILGVRKTMEGIFYSKIFEQNGLEAIEPNEQEKRYIHNSIYDELVHNQFERKTRDAYRSIMLNLAARGVEGVALACTEIPLLIAPEECPIPAFSTTELHCQAAVEMALGESATV